MAKVVEDQRARQGGQGRPVLYVLVASLILLAVAAIGFTTWGRMTTPTSQQTTTAPAGGQPAGGASSAGSSGSSSTVPAGNPAYPAPAEPKTGAPGTQGNQPKQ